ncbi:sulfurtransferase [Janthinobacterium fluminis]|uniref:Rhodanese-like domain-containing protein n=1 Tax=Janthinobacterium fluminis TaxID=2987524 RepID=A0ABT5K7T1_9BURK|nr:rhodanese-like domain-containing protein [Janthinobacterium fluminis]MDC8759807.1 rhodanese-like domain-containing protein [Janthinobacterium fluminis]
MPLPSTIPPGWRPDLARWQQLVPPARLAALLAAAPHWRLFEVGCGGAAQFCAGHIPGAGYLDTNDMERAPLWNKVPDAELLQLLLRHGVRHDSSVVLYGRNPLAAARAAQLMLYAGVADVRLLDGGLAAWRGAGGALATGAPRRYRAAAAFGAPFPARPDYLIDAARVRQLLRQPDAALVSIRTWREFTGQTSGYGYIDARGDIPGARWGRAGAGDDINSMSEFHDAAGRMLPAEAIGALWRGAGVHAGQQAAFYCGTGWRASLAFYYAWLMGWPRISVYDGGWCEWSSDPANPVVRRAAPP